ncbi:hypothetical protein ABZW96_35660 [Nocardia sp. NPDC004168]|uniref:hypothetical protein n=1 Tax=Nocardia sp. NPDC004168 TaxID=3154452 RepID=UPI0033B8871D
MATPTRDLEIPAPLTLDGNTLDPIGGGGALIGYGGVSTEFHVDSKGAAWCASEPRMAGVAVMWGLVVSASSPASDGICITFTVSY